MKNYASNRVRNVVLLGHSGSGKTTYAEAALYYSGATKRFGKVEDGNTVSDYEAEEIRRKVSINTSVIPVEWQDTKINFLDTPGYFDFAAEVKLAMNVADTGMIMVSAKSGVEVGTEKAWEYCEEMHLPRMFFINQMDDENADFERTLAELRKNFGKAVAPVQIPFNDEDGKFVGFINVIKRDARKKVDGKLQKCEMPADKVDQVEKLRAMVIEVAAESSEELMEKFFNDEELTEDEIYDGLLAGIEAMSVAPVLCGSATLGQAKYLLAQCLTVFQQQRHHKLHRRHCQQNAEGKEEDGLADHQTQLVHGFIVGIKGLRCLFVVCLRFTLQASGGCILIHLIHGHIAALMIGQLLSLGIKTEHPHQQHSHTGGHHTNQHGIQQSGSQPLGQAGFLKFCHRRFPSFVEYPFSVPVIIAYLF